jgi:cytochrome c
MYINILLVFSFLFFSACNDTKSVKKLDGKMLLEQKCASCHNLNLPPVISSDELAPPMMAIAFHVYSFVKPSDESQRETKAIEFVVDYVAEPSLKKSFCDKESLNRYGLMPSQKENVTKEETKAIGEYIFKNYTQENLTKMQQEQNRYNALSAGEKIALKYRCLGCHKPNKKIVGPSFKDISKKFTATKKDMISSIKNGSKNSWKNSNGAVMPPFEKISKEDLEILSEWILKF